PMPEGDIGNWVHLAATFNGSTWTLYRNGQAIGSKAGLVSVQVNTNWAIGARGGGGASFFSGAIDEVRMYNRALSESEINALSTPPLLFSAATLAPGASGNFTLSAAAGTCSVTANVIATGRDNCSSRTVTNTASATCPVPTAPSIQVTLVCPVTPVASGALITYTGTVRNSGDIALNNVTVSNSQSSPPIVFTV